MAGDVDALRPLTQRHAEPTPLPLGAPLDTLHLEQVGQPDADAAEIPFNALVILGGAGDGVRLIEPLQGAGHCHGDLPGRVPLNLLVEAQATHAVVQAEHVASHLLLQRRVRRALKQEAAGLCLPGR